MQLTYDIDSLDNRDPDFVRRFADLLEPFYRLWFRPTVRGLERIPAGAGLYVGNHNGSIMTMDTFVFGIAVLRERGIDDVPYGLGHEVAIRFPLAHQLIMPLGAVRAGHGSAERLFEAGKKVLVYPGGDLDAMRPFRHRDRVVFGPRRGYIRLALRTGVPIIPVVAAGAHATLIILDDGRWLARGLGLHRAARIKVWPIALSLPWGLTIGVAPYFPLPTRMLIEVLDPIRFPETGPEAAADDNLVEACHAQVHRTMEEALRRLSAERKSTARGALMGLLSF